jgi:tetratricopeptide (TPR) repeat protein
MKDIYAAGIRAYQEQDYDTAIQYLQKALGMEDVYSQRFYYAEAAAMLGVIYQFHVIHNDKALHYYELALKYEKKNSTARRHIKEVQRLMKEGE